MKTPITHECDVLVAGWGVAGIAAALAAARQGARVILLEKQFILGGLATCLLYNKQGNGYDLSMLGYAEIPEEDRTEETKPLVARKFQGVDGQELSEMVQFSHERILEEVVKKRQKNPAYMPVTIATIPQIRMTRRIVGGYTMETSDERKEFEDSIGMIGNWKKKGPVYEIPFHALHGSRVKNLITAGRNISSSDAMWDVTRVIPVYAVTGEAAGLATTMTDDLGLLSVANLQKKLTNNCMKLFYNEL